MEDCVTTESVVLSITRFNQGLSEPKKPSSTAIYPTSGGMVQSLADIHQLFKEVLSVIKPIRKIFSDVADLAHRIQIQQVAFENGCKVLLATVAKSRQDVDQMIEDQSHPIWKDTSAHRKLDTMMARFYYLCRAVLERFRGSLDEFRVGLHALSGRGTKKATRRFRSWLDRSNPPTSGTIENLAKLVQNMRSYNDLFCSLVWQAVTRRSGSRFESSFRRNLGLPYAPQAAGGQPHHFECIQRASQILYNTLSNVWTCGEREARSLIFELSLEYAKAGASVQTEDFHFTVAVTSPYLKSPYRSDADIAYDDLCMYQTVKEDRFPKQIDHRNRVDEAAAWVDPSDLSQLDADTAAHRVGGQDAATCIRAELLRHRVSDLSLGKSWCRWLRNSSVTIGPTEEMECSCVGRPETRISHRFLFSSVLSDDYQKRGSHSLDDVLVRANIESRRIPLQDRLRTALFLAAGVLRLNTSSWLRQAWSSKDIHFFDVNGGEGCTLGEPFLMIEFNNDTARGPVYETKAATRSCLLSLGLVLIELAFSAPWRKLQLDQSLTEDIFEWERNLLDLMRLSDTVSRELGSRYAKVVQTCLFQGLETNQTDDLGNAELNEVISEDIVRELDRCLSAVTF